MILKKLLHSFLGCAFLLQAMGSPVMAADFAALLPVPGVMTGPSESFLPASLKGVRLLDTDSGLRLEFVLTSGQDKSAEAVSEANVRSLVSYFLSALTLSSDQMWVNLSPYEGDRIIPEKFGTTEMGRDLLAQDYLLKQLTASLLYPEKDLGKRFWDQVYQQAQERFGVTDIPVDTFNKVWITPDKAKVYENGMTGFILKSHLKVMLESDYLAQNSQAQPLPPSVPSSELTKQIMRSVIIPAIEKEVNEGRQFAKLRQIYDAQILAVWFKTALKSSVLGRSYADKGKMGGIDVNAPSVNEAIYERYLEAFRKGAFNYVKEETDPLTQEVLPRKYFSGGSKAWTPDYTEITDNFSDEELPQEALQVVQVALGQAETTRPNYIPDRDIRRMIAVLYGILLLSHGGPLDVATFFNYCNHLLLLEEDVFTDPAHAWLEAKIQKFVSDIYIFSKQYNSLLDRVRKIESDLEIGQIAPSDQVHALREDALKWMTGTSMRSWDANIAAGMVQFLNDFDTIVSELSAPELKEFMKNNPGNEMFVQVLNTVTRVRENNARPMVKYLRSIANNTIGESAVYVSGRNISLSDFLQDSESKFKVKSDDTQEYQGSTLLFKSGDWDIKSVPPDLLWLILERFKENGVGIVVKQKWAWEILEWVEQQAVTQGLTLAQLKTMSRDELFIQSPYIVAILDKINTGIDLGPKQLEFNDKVISQMDAIREQRALGLTKDDLRISYRLERRQINGQDNIILKINNPGRVGKKTVSMKNGELRQIDLLASDFVPGVKNVFLNDPKRENLTFGGLSLPFNAVVMSNIEGGSIDVRNVEDHRGVSFVEIELRFLAAENLQPELGIDVTLAPEGEIFGGIDLNEKNLQLDLEHGPAVARAGAGASSTLDSAEGLLPVSIQISPLKDLAGYLQGTIQH